MDTKVLTPNNGFQRVTHCAAAEANVSDSTVRSAIHRGRSLANSLWQFRVVPGLSRARWQASASRVVPPPDRPRLSGSSWDVADRCCRGSTALDQVRPKPREPVRAKWNKASRDFWNADFGWPDEPGYPAT